MAYIKVSEAARLLGVTNVTVREYIRRGRLVASRTPGGQYRIEESALADMMAKPALLEPISPDAQAAIMRADEAGYRDRQSAKQREKAQVVVFDGNDI